jgi:hypothetical protein
MISNTLENSHGRAWLTAASGYAHDDFDMQKRAKKILQLFV